MALYDELFYFHGRIDKRGVLLELLGEAFADAPNAGKSEIGLQFYLADFWQGDPHTSASRTPEIIKDAVRESLVGISVAIETDFFPTSGKCEKVKLHFIPRINDKQDTDEVFFSALNITPYVQETAYYKERSEQLLYAAETAEIGLFFWDHSKEDIFTTPKFNEFYGLSSDEIMTRDKFARVIHPDDALRVHETVSRSHAEYSECNVEYRVVLDAGIRWIWIRGKSFPATDTNSAFTMGSGRDVTERKIYDEKLTELFASEKRARDLVEKANWAKDQFIAMVSHELRAPLNAVLGWVNILLTKKVDEEARINALETIERSARVQAKLISDLVDSSKIISGKLNLEFHPVDVQRALAFVFEAQKPMAEAKNIVFRYFPGDEAVKINADLSRVQQIFTNLITNAIKFTPDNGTVEVELKRDNGNVCISIKDTGKGIDPDELPFIFERFFQARVSESADKSGLGLGLSIVFSLVKQHGGTVTAESGGSGLGSIFTVTLPVLKMSEKMSEDFSRAENEQPVAQKDPLQKIRVLLVEDNDDSREVLQIFLEQMGAEVTAAPSAADAMKSFGSNGPPPDVLISDISMPEEDGYSLIKRIRRLPPQKGGRTPAIALTAFASQEDKRRTLSEGFQIHHPKPFEPDLLIREILEIVK